jgi:hypothetical protein
VVNGAKAKNVQEGLEVFDDVNNIGAILQQDASTQGEGSQGDQ